MSEMNIFEYAAKNKLRFQYKGQVSVENLYDLPVTELDKIYKTLNREAKQTEEDSLLDITVKDTGLEVKIEIVKTIVAEKIAAANKAKKERENYPKRQRILEAMAKKDEQAMDAASKEDLQKMLDELSKE